jgi:hypothetical protein
MSFETRTIHSENGELKVDVFAEGDNFSMLSVTYNEEFIDGDHWIKYKLFPALKSYLCRNLTPMFLKILEEAEIPEYYYLDLYQMLSKAEAIGWMNYIKYSKENE